MKPRIDFTEPLEDWVLARAVEIHAEKRTVFHFGDPPYGHIMDIRQDESGATWTLHISDHLGATAMDALASMLGNGAAKGAEAMAAGLAYIAAATECVRLSAKAHEAGEQ